MTRAALAKLLLLVILAFIICLPEFFTLYRVSKVSFHCISYRPCEQVKGENGKTGNAEAKKDQMCDLSQTPDHEKWEQACAQKDQNNTTDSASDLRRGRNDPKMISFMCETDMEMAELHKNTSTSAHELHLEVSVELQLTDAETLNLTLYGRSNHSSLSLYQSKEEEEEEGDKEQLKAFYCCLPLLPTSESANQSRCLLWLANQTVGTETAKTKLPWKRKQKDEWRCTVRVLWLALLCLVLLTIVTTVIGEIYRGKHLCRKPKVHPVGYNFTAQQLNEVRSAPLYEMSYDILFHLDDEKKTGVTTPEGTNLHSYKFHSWSELSPIQEVDSQNDIETLRDGNADHCYTANLHHRGHPSISSIKEE